MTPFGGRSGTTERNQPDPTMARLNIEEIGEAFANGDYDHHNSTMNVRSATGKNDSGLLYSYGAVIAARFADGHIVFYDGWYGYSVTTSGHITKLKDAVEAAGAEYEVSTGKFGNEPEAVTA